MTTPNAGDVEHDDAFLVTLAPRSLWTFAKKPKKDASGRRNPVANAYFELWGLGFTRWLFSLVALGFSILTVYWEPSSPLYEAAIAQLAVSGLHVLLPHPYVRSRSPTDARTPKWYPIFVAASTVPLAAVMSVMIALVAGGTTDITLNKRAYYSRVSTFDSSLARRLMYFMIIADATALLCNLSKAYFWYKLQGKFDHGDIRETYLLASKQVDEKVAGDIVC
ncbi:hypothetical protein F5X68DRAFT_235181 [Plectosphaerella plurivora]|uniref:Uncharacterized protein n=1 Tax=Plectosphaerella plurivora TaxID=936078 RepID=A0A9P8V6J9_9PEZI|nr:hypothetical protein F5X68DRAFT_235181 [Plectosphaerella plurivora]